MTSDPLQPPQPPITGWQAPPGPSRQPTLYLGLPLQVWVFAWLPLAPAACLAIIAPGFLAPMADARVRLAGIPPIAVFLLLPLINLAVAKVTRNESVTWVTIAVTSFLGVVLAILGPAFVLILLNLSM